MAVGASIAALTLGVLAPAGVAEAQRAPSLRVSSGTSSYVPGQAMTYAGNIGLTGRRRSVHLQFHMGNPNHPWNDVAHSYARTRRDGHFRIVYPAPSMDGISMRVASGRAHTPAVRLHATSQDLTLSVPGGSTVRAGAPFRINVDTAATLGQSTPPVFTGRTLTLQRRLDDGRWDPIPVRQATTDSNGRATFENLTTGSSVTYRVREENWFAGRNRIGWFPSFPLTVQVAGASSPQAADASTSTAAGSTTTGPSARLVGAGDNAGKVHRWGPQLWDFAWEYGESLSSPPARGTDRQGWWLDTSTGSGRAAPHNGQLTLDSQRNWTGPGDSGTTTVTLQGNPMRYGRWETKLRLKQLETQTGASDYHARVELVPDGATTGDSCGITIADVPGDGSSIGIGVTTPVDGRWSATRPIDIGTNAVAVAVEVTQDHITWFLNGRAIGTVKSSAAVSDAPMTLRLRLVGDNAHEYNHTQMHSDWQRAWSMDRGTPVTDGAPLTRGSFTGDC